ncbi:hypothetical protein ACFE04_000650 [Oxalis oulophora]
MIAWVGNNLMREQCQCLSISSISVIVRRQFNNSASSLSLQGLDEDYDFLPWLERKAATTISSLVSIAKSSSYGERGKCLLASKPIRAGDCLLKVPFHVQLSPHNLPPDINASLGDNKVGNFSKLATLLLIEMNLGLHSQWAPYISRLPRPGEIHSSIFWNEDELEMIRQSHVYSETLNHKVHIKKEFLLIKPTIEFFPEIFGDVSFEDFMHAYATVGSRAWGSTKGLSLIPFADFLNHNGTSESLVLNDEDTQLSEVISDRDYSPGEEVLIRYGRFPNSTLLLDFGFTLPHNMYDQVEIHIDVSHYDHLRDMKLKLLQEHFVPKKKAGNGFSSSWDTFIIREVRCSRGNGKGLPQSLRAFSRVLCSISADELSYLASEAAQSDGRLARRPLRNNGREFQAHEFLSSEVDQLIEDYRESIEVITPINCPSTPKILDHRRKMAQDLMLGELRILESASAWLKNHCTSRVQVYMSVDMMVQVISNELNDSLMLKVVVESPGSSVPSSYIFVKRLSNERVTSKQVC